MIKSNNIISNTENYRERVDKVEDSICVQVRRGGEAGVDERGASGGLAVDIQSGGLARG